MGRLGKDKSPYAVLIAAMLALVGCAEPTRDGRYAGAVDATSGTCGPSSGGGRFDGSLLLRGDDVLFTPNEGVIVLHGRIDAIGHITALAVEPGADHKPFQMVFDGDLAGNRVSGRYATPQCRAMVRLDRVG